MICGPVTDCAQLSDRCQQVIKGKGEGICGPKTRRKIITKTKNKDMNSTKRKNAKSKRQRLWVKNGGIPQRNFNAIHGAKIPEDAEGNSLLYFQGFNSHVISTPDDESPTQHPTKKPTLAARTKPHIQNSNGKAKHRLPIRQYPDRLVIKIKRIPERNARRKTNGTCRSRSPTVETSPVPPSQSLGVLCFPLSPPSRKGATQIQKVSLASQLASQG
jgi:hypothetical protein